MSHCRLYKNTNTSRVIDLHDTTNYLCSLIKDCTENISLWRVCLPCYVGLFHIRNTVLWNAAMLRSVKCGKVNCMASWFNTSALGNTLEELLLQHICQIYKWGHLKIKLCFAQLLQDLLCRVEMGLFLYQVSICKVNYSSDS